MFVNSYFMLVLWLCSWPNFIRLDPILHLLWLPKRKLQNASHNNKIIFDNTKTCLDRTCVFVYDLLPHTISVYCSASHSNLSNKQAREPFCYQSLLNSVNLFKSWKRETSKWSHKFTFFPSFFRSLGNESRLKTVNYFLSWLSLMFKSLRLWTI